MIEVYYAEDDEIIAQSVKEYLEEKNCRVTTFGTLAALRSALRSRIPTILLLDWNMPDGQGSELCRWIRERRADLPIIFLTVLLSMCPYGMTRRRNITSTRQTGTTN